MQNIQALTPLTNDGILLKPYLVDKIVDPTTGEVIFKGKRKEVERVASTTTVQKILSLMNKTVNEVGFTGSGYRMDDHTLIGKTGTAQISRTGGGGYYSGKSDIISSFAGIYPKDNPEIIIYASVKRPSGGSQRPINVAVKDVVTNISKYLGYDPETLNTEIIEEYKVPSLINKTVDKAKTMLDTDGITNIVLGNGKKVIKQYPSHNQTITNKDKIYLITNDSNISVPNVVGLSSKKASELLKTLGLKVILENKGYVISQNIAPSTVISKGMEITLVLEPKFNSS
jgi:penicillin-binding protein 2B